MADAPAHSLPAPNFGYWRWVLPGGVLLALLYLPTLSTPFDFTDDGNLVYPTPAASPAERASIVWQRIEGNYDHLGPFRPVLWVHWEIAAEAFRGNALAWRAFRLTWCAFAAVMLLWFLAELRLPMAAALVAGAVAMWTPYRNEIWTSLTLSEGVAMPYALLALVCARRALRSPRSLRWDLLGMACVLAALGCKNTFAALVPAQLFLRLSPDGVSLREGVRRHWRRAALVSLTLLIPVAHYVYFKLNWHPGQYSPPGPTLAQFQRILSGLAGAVSLPFLGAGVALAVVAQMLAKRSAGAWLRDLVRGHRAAVVGGLLLLGGGVLVYLPMDAMSGRYSMPGVWGLDVLLAVALAGLAALPRGHLVRATWAALGVGLVIVLVAGVGRQQKFAARIHLLWQALEVVERQAPPGASVAWYCGDPTRGGLDEVEGVHFHYHLTARGRGDVRVRVFDDHGRLQRRPEIDGLGPEPEFAVWSAPQGPGEAGWQERQQFVVRYWAGQRQFQCWLGQRRRDHARLPR
jgi:hypothetical protein